MDAQAINKKTLRQKMALRGIFTFAELADRVNCTPTSIQLAIERPSRFGNVIAKIETLLGVTLEQLTQEPKIKEPANV